MLRKILASFIILLLAAACSGADKTQTDGKLKVVATTSIIGDVVQNIGAEAIDLTILMPAGTDPHSFEPSPRQIAALSDADLIFINGFDLEENLLPVLDSAATPEKIVTVSQGVDAIQFSGDKGNAGDSGQRFDPHVWLDPNNVSVWTETIEAALVAADNAHAQVYHAHADAYRAQLRELDAWIRAQIEPLLPLRVVTDHKVFGYFARRYGIEQVGAIIPSYSAMAQASAQEMAQLEDAIKQVGVKAILVGNTVNPNLSRQVAEDTGVQLIPIYTGSLSDTNGPAATYLDFMRYNVNAIVQAAQEQ